MELQLSVMMEAMEALEACYVAVNQALNQGGKPELKESNRKSSKYPRD